ncbi:18152_t:CDS:1, partial [Cetraspora pellucida]
MIKLTLNLFLIILFSCLLTSSIVVDGFLRPHQPPKSHEPRTIASTPTTTFTLTLTETITVTTNCATAPSPTITCPQIIPSISENTAYFTCTKRKTECGTLG